MYFEQAYVMSVLCTFHIFGNFHDTYNVNLSLYLQLLVLIVLFFSRLNHNFWEGPK